MPSSWAGGFGIDPHSPGGMKDGGRCYYRHSARNRSSDRLSHRAQGHLVRKEQSRDLNPGLFSLTPPGVLHSSYPFVHILSPTSVLGLSGITTDYLSLLWHEGFL